MNLHQEDSLRSPEACRRDMARRARPFRRAHLSAAAASAPVQRTRGFDYFVDAMRPSLAIEMPMAPPSELRSILSEQWKQMDERHNRSRDRGSSGKRNRKWGGGGRGGRGSNKKQRRR